MSHFEDYEFPFFLPIFLAHKKRNLSVPCIIQRRSILLPLHR